MDNKTLSPTRRGSIGLFRSPFYVRSKSHLVFLLFPCFVFKLPAVQNKLLFYVFALQPLQPPDSGKAQYDLLVSGRNVLLHRKFKVQNPPGVYLSCSWILSLPPFTSEHVMQGAKKRSNLQQIFESYHFYLVSCFLLILSSDGYIYTRRLSPWDTGFRADTKLFRCNANRKSFLWYKNLFDRPM